MNMSNRTYAQEHRAAAEAEFLAHTKEVNMTEAEAHAVVDGLFQSIKQIIPENSDQLVCAPPSIRERQTVGARNPITPASNNGRISGCTVAWAG
jgi:hypothetical protein